MARRPCLEDGCPIQTNSTRCPQHTRQRDRARGTRQQRGYTSEHDRLRARWQSRLDDGELVLCWRCLTKGKRTAIDPAAWDLGHQDDDRSRYAGPECIPCNRSTTARQ